MALEEQIINKLKKLERRSEYLVEFWLEHSKYLSDQTTERQKLEFLYPADQMSALETPINANGCEFCNGENTVFYEIVTDTYTCHDCGQCQNVTRTPYLRFIPESSVYKHSVHLHQILHEMQCLRESVPPDIIGDVREAIGAPFTYDRIKKSLRKLGYHQHYSMVYTIQRELDSTFFPLKLAFAQEEKLQGLFFQYIALGGIGGRKNRLNYHFVLGKIAAMCGYGFIIPYIHPPKGKKSMEESEKVWKLVCTTLGWTYS